MVHRRRMDTALHWILALCAGIHGPLRRSFPLYSQVQSELDYLATDACPWGMAGVLFRRGAPVAWYACPLSKDDLRRFDAVVGESGWNTTWEALALLIACRLWLVDSPASGSPFADRGVSVAARVKSDSLSALRAMAKLASSSPALNLISRELALDSVLGLYTVGLCIHIPGVANNLPDALSRMWAPDAYKFPRELVGVPETPAPARDGKFWKTAMPKHRAGRRGH